MLASKFFFCCSRSPEKNLNKTTLSHSTQARHRCELARARKERKKENLRKILFL